jgi:hypothetical protein
MTDTPACRYTVADLEAARAAFAAEEARWDNYSGNNPDKFRTQRQAALEHVRAVEAELKRAGVISYSAAELISRELQQAFPNSPSRSIVEHKGRLYQVRYMPNGLSRSGNVKCGYTATWKELTPEQAAAERLKKQRRRKEP